MTCNQAAIQSIQIFIATLDKAISKGPAALLNTCISGLNT
jgi:hypothetical protein